MLAKINCIDIIGDHLHTFKDYNSNKKTPSDFLLFYAFPLLLALVGLKYIPTISRDLVNVLITAFSVFAALLFNLLLLMFDIIRRSKANPKTQAIKLELLQEIYSNISYSIFVSVVAIVALLIPLLGIDLPNISLTAGYSDRVASFVIYFLLGNFVLTLLMILKRVHVLLSSEFND